MRSQTPAAKQCRSGSIIGMASCYALGNFADNFFKQAAILMAASLAASGVSSVRLFTLNISGTDLQSVATVLFTLPFILFSAWAGWLADRAQKKNIVIGAKLMELATLCLGAAALIYGWWAGILLVVFLMALQSTIFNPALNGAIPESFVEARVPRVNSFIRLASTAAILAGVAGAGFFLDLRPGGLLPDAGSLAGETYGRAMAGFFLICVSITGVFTAFTLKRRAKTADVARAFPWSGPVESLRNLMECRKDAQLFTVMLGDAFFYGLAAIALISIANMSKALGYSDTLSGLLSACIMVGIAAGSLIAGRYPATSWRVLMAPGMIGLGLCLLLCALTPLVPAHWGPLQVIWFAGTLLCAGISGGIFIIPITSFIQIRPAAGEKGKVIGASNFLSFSSMGLCGAAFGLIGLLPAALTFVLYGLLCLLFARAFIRPRLRKLEGASLAERARSPLGFMLRAVMSLRYRVAEKGLNEIMADDKRPILFLPNHPALIDPFLVFSRIAGLRPRALADEHRLSSPLGRWLVRAMRIITIPDAGKDGRRSVERIRLGLKNLGLALQGGDNILLYPSGKIYRSAREKLGANSAVTTLLREAPEARVVLVRCKGLWGSRFSYASGKNPSFFKVLFSLVPPLLLNMLIFMPRRRVAMEFTEVTDLPREDKMALNKRLEEYYNQAEMPAATVPLFFWQGSRPMQIPERVATGHDA